MIYDLETHPKKKEDIGESGELLSRLKMLSAVMPGKGDLVKEIRDKHNKFTK